MGPLVKRGLPLALGIACVIAAEREAYALPPIALIEWTIVVPMAASVDAEGDTPVATHPVRATVDCHPRARRSIVGVRLPERVCPYYLAEDDRTFLSTARDPMRD